MYELPSISGIVRRILNKDRKSVNLIVLSVFLATMGQVWKVISVLIGAQENPMIGIFWGMSILSFGIGLGMYANGE